MIRLYAADMRELAGRADELDVRLSLERRQRMNSLKSETDRLRCLAAGLLLDTVFKKRAKTDIVRDTYGKPMLTGGPCFNLSHAGDYAVLAVSETEIGVDIERWRRADTAALARRFYHPGEQAVLAEAADPVERFFTIWSLKESYVKALGRGFAVSPASFAVLPEGRDGASLLGGGDYHFKRYFDFPGYALAVCALEDAFPEAATVLSYA